MSGRNKKTIKLSGGLLVLDFIMPFHQQNPFFKSLKIPIAIPNFDYFLVFDYFLSRVYAFIIQVK